LVLLGGFAAGVLFGPPALPLLRLLLVDLRFWVALALCGGPWWGRSALPPGVLLWLLPGFGRFFCAPSLASAAFLFCSGRVWVLPMSFSSFLPAASAASLVGGVPSSFSVSVGSAPVPSSGFLPALPGAVVLSAPSDLPGLLFRGPGGAPSLRVAWSCSVSGLSGSLVARAAGFPGGAGGSASGAFFAAVEAAVASGAPVFVGGAPGARSGSVFPGFFCAVSSSPFGGGASASSSGAAPLRF